MIFRGGQSADGTAQHIAAAAQQSSRAPASSHAACIARQQVVAAAATCCSADAIRVVFVFFITLRLRLHVIQVDAFFRYHHFLLRSRKARAAFSARTPLSSCTHTHSTNPLQCRRALAGTEARQRPHSLTNPKEKSRSAGCVSAGLSYCPLLRACRSIL